MKGTQMAPAINNYETNFKERVSKDFRANKSLYILVLPVILYYIIFKYVPMYGAVIAFQDFSPRAGILGSEWIGFKNFVDFFGGPYAFRVIKNTLAISFSSLLLNFPAPIILALLINEIRNNRFKRCVQTISYLPHFISIVVVCGMIKDFTMDTGLINNILYMLFGKLGYTPQTMLNNENLFVPIYVISNMWQGIGWSSIIYLAALSGIDEELYEATKIDGAGKWKQTLYVTIPGITPTIVVMFVLAVGNIMNVGFEKIILLQNDLTLSTSDVISSFVYRKGLIEFDYGFSTAVDLFNSVINCVLLFLANGFSKKINGNGLW